MIFRILLIAVMAAIALHGWRQKQRAPSVGWAIVLTALAGASIAAFPDLTQTAADLLGIGRGVDLMFYLFIVTTILLIANIHLRMMEMRDSMTEITRRLAIATANESKSSSGSGRQRATASLATQTD